MTTPTLMNILITSQRVGGWPKIPAPSSSGGGAPSRGGGPQHPLAARQSLHTPSLSLSGNSSCSKSGDCTEEGCPWDTHTHPGGRASSCHLPAHGWLHFGDSPSPGAHGGGWGSSGRKPGLPCYQPHVQCPQFRPGVSTGLEALGSLVATPDERCWLCVHPSHTLALSHQGAREK